MTRRPRLVTIYTMFLCAALALGLFAPTTSQARPAGQAGAQTAEQYVDENIQRLEQRAADDAAFQSGRAQAAAAGADMASTAAAVEQQRQELRSQVYGFAWPQPPYPGGPEARPYPWALLGAPFLPVFPTQQTTFMGIRPAPDDPSYGALVRGYSTPLGFITNFDETRGYGCASRAALVAPDVPTGIDYCVNYWDAQQALLAWSEYLNRSPNTLVAGASPDAVVAGIRAGLEGWVQGESTLTQVRPTPIPTPVPQVTGPGSVTGFVLNAQTGRGIFGAAIQGPGGQLAVSEGGGRYTITGLPIGRVELTASYPGYITDTQQVIVSSPTEPARLDFVLSRVLAPGEVRIVLVWGAVPRDLDSHIWLPGASTLPTGQTVGTLGAATASGQHIFYAARGDQNRAPFVGLDVDDVDGFGPETITIRRLQPGRYTYAVHQFTTDGTLALSGARVTVLAGDRVVQRFQVPTTGSPSDRWWTVFELDGATGSLIPRGDLSANPPISTAAGGR
jgi:hypothetical protein